MAVRVNNVLVSGKLRGWIRHHAAPFLLSCALSQNYAKAEIRGLRIRVGSDGRGDVSVGRANSDLDLDFIIGPGDLRVKNVKGLPRTTEDKPG